MVGGVLYTTAGMRRDVVAIDATTGETLWMFRYDEGSRGQRAPNRTLSGRGVSYWTADREEAAPGPDHVLPVPGQNSRAESAVRPSSARGTRSTPPPTT